ncbi:MAG: hypothetical protein J6T79_06430, partial [Verrucomicrobia bacterium]|nr:hypothetical protein [Verrucomicrobiota bacterium]
KRQDLILETISVNPGIRRKELSEYVHVAVRTLDRDLIEMTANIQTAKIEHRGSRKTGGWFLKS